eukprot:gene34822-45048_t
MIVAGNTSIFGRRLCPTSFRMLSASSLNTDTATGSGPAGLCSAIMLAKRGYRNIMLYDKLSEPPSPNAPIWEDLNAERSYNIGINARGKISLQRFDLMSRIEKFAAPVVGRKGWNPNTPIDDPSEMIFDDYDSHSQCIQRDRLTSCLLQEIREKYSDTIKICFNTECVDIKWIEEGTSNEKVQLTLRREESDTPPSIWNEETHFVIGADGTQSAIRSQMEIAGDDFFHKKFEDKNLRVYRTIPLYFPNNNPNWRKDLNYSVRTKYKINLHALPTKEGLYVGVILFHPNDIRMNKIHTADDAKTFFKELFPMFLPYILQKDFEIFASKSPSRLPKFSYAGPVLHKGKSVALVGDSIHTVKPFFGLGVNSAFEDIAVLDQAFDDADNNREKAFQLYTKARAEDTKALVEISSKLDVIQFRFNHFVTKCNQEIL